MKNEMGIEDKIKSALTFEGINLELVNKWVEKHSIDESDIYKAYSIKDDCLAGKNCFFACVLNDISVDEYVELIK